MTRSDLLARWERFRWGFSLTDLQACANTIFVKWDAVVITLECSYLNRRLCLRICDNHRYRSRYSCAHFQDDGDVKLIANADLDNTMWFAHSKAHGRFYMLPRSRDVGRL